MYKMLYILIFSTLLFSCSDSENLDSTNSRKQDPEAKEKIALLGVAAVQIGDKWGYINHRGEVVIKPQFDDAGKFSEGLAAVKISDKVGYINHVGEIIIEPQFDDAGHFSEGDGRLPGVEGWAIVRIGYQWGYINLEGKFFEGLVSFSEGLARVRIGDKWGYINHVGEIIIEPQFDGAGHFSAGVGRLPGVAGLARVRIGDKWGYINREGKFFARLGSFSEGLAWVVVGDKVGYINQVGEIVITPQFDSAGDFSEGLARVEIGGKWGYINREGKIVINPQFDSAGDFFQ